MTDTGERSYKATPRRLEEARREGRLGNSRDLIGWLAMAGAALMMPVVAGSTADAIRTIFVSMKAVIGTPDPQTAEAFIFESLGKVILIIAPMLAGAIIGAVVGAFAQGGVHFKRLKFSFDHFNLVSGVQRMFGMQALWEGAKALLKTGVVGLALMFAIQGITPLFVDSGLLPLNGLAETAAGVVQALLIASIVAGLILAGFDVMVVIRRNRKHTMMTYKEIKDETKNTEGDPHVRSHRRQRALAISRNRMIAAVASADVVLLNPTHIAVALRYEPGKSAPRVVAKGAGAIAAKIRERAADARVPMVHDIPLARALHAACDIGQEIPEELYTAVARVLAFVMALRRRGAALGVHTMTQMPTRQAQARPAQGGRSPAGQVAVRR